MLKCRDIIWHHSVINLKCKKHYLASFSRVQKHYLSFLGSSHQSSSLSQVSKTMGTSVSLVGGGLTIGTFLSFTIFFLPFIKHFFKPLPTNINL